ncbi:MAG: Unknown protein [uncultured Sulfurovum sp.]|uniref:Uncharacterized protein n=1 Tax=uncultured Sulfurovum sp. TaxID=269237 RepID=A0A6S6T810_9BACT|nr:MAG: Unknown protein [uncultured Sulfurovum sp.]
MKYLIKVWDIILLVFAFSTTKHCDKLKLDSNDEDILRGTTSKKVVKPLSNE